MPVDFPPENSATVEFEEAVHKHLRRGLKPPLERAGSAEQLRPDHVRRQRVSAGDDQPGLDRVAAERPRREGVIDNRP